MASGACNAWTTSTAEWLTKRTMPAISASRYLTPVKNAPAETLESFVQRQDAATLANILIELAARHEKVQERLVRMQLANQPDRLAAAFRKTLAALQGSAGSSYGYRESHRFGLELEAWLDQVGRELVPADPPAALALFASFIESDATWFECDDSDGCIGDAVRAACRHWLQAAAQCETPASDWPARLLALFQADEYGARDELLRCADLLLAEPALRDLVALFESRMAVTLADRLPSDNVPYETVKASAALSLLAQALHDPDIEVRAVLSYSPQPNAQQREKFASAFLEADRPADAMVWLQDPWDSWNESRLSLLSDALGRLGRFDESALIRQQSFERTMSVFGFQRWLEHLPQAGRAEAMSLARRLALEHDDLTAAVTLLLELGDATSAEARLISEPTRIDGRDYLTLVPMAQALRSHECWRGETVVYRALLRGILDRAYARAYAHAARYWFRLREIADSGVGLLPLQPHEGFEAEIRARHARKVAFWAYVNGTRRAELVEDDSLDE